MNVEDRQGELQSLKQEVADLWMKFRRQEPPPLPGKDEAHQALVERYHELELRRRRLLDRRAVLRHEKEVLELRSSRVAPVIRFLGGVVGAVVSVAVFVPFVDSIAGASIVLEPAHGAALLTLSLAMLAIAVAGD